VPRLRFGQDDVRLELRGSKVRFADDSENSLPVSTRALVTQRYFDPGRHQSSSSRSSRSARLNAWCVGHILQLQYLLPVRHHTP
jgi:hypothetical protein